MRLTWPLTGRMEEMRVIDAAITAPDHSGIVMCGAAGVGKSRIAREALSSAKSRGCAVRWAVGTSSARALPLGAFASWAGSEGADSLHLVGRVIEALTTASPDTPVVVGVDDVHLLDDLSTFVLHQIVQRGVAKVVLTLRDGEAVPSAAQEVWKDGQFAWLDLQPLSRDETTALVSAALGGSLDPVAAKRLWKLTRGNVLYLRTIVEGEVTDGRLAAGNGYWRWTGDPVVPPSLVELIESRIATLPKMVGEVVDALAVGEPMELASLSRITDPAAVEEADARGLITLEPVGDSVEVRVAHPLYGEVRRKYAPASRLRRLRALVATDLAASDGRDDVRVVVRRATLSLDSDLEPNADLLLRAARGAVWLADMALADRLADAAMRAGAGADANLVRAHALSWLSRGKEADAVLAAIPTDELTEADRVRLAALRASNMLWALADPAGAKKLIDDTSQTAQSQARLYIDAFLTVYWFAMGKPEMATQLLKSLELDDLPAILGAETAWAITAIFADAGRTSKAVAAADAGYVVATRLFDAPHMRFIIADAHVGALLTSGRIREAWDVAEDLRQQGSDLPGLAQLLSAGVAGRAALAYGRLHTGCSLLDPVAETLSASGESNGLAYRYQLSRTIALAMRGRVDDAARAFVALEKRRHPSWQFLEYEFALAEAWVGASEGAVTEAIARLMSGAESAGANGQFGAEVMCLQTAVQFGGRSCAARLRELEAIVEGPRVGVAARFAAAQEVRDAAALAAVSDQFQQMGDLVAAVDAAAHAAITYRRQDLRGSALSWSSRAHALAEQCGASTPALRQATESLPLTDREREVVMLIGEGLSNRSIAERLTVSTRTVEGHIYRAMAKTGVASRDELAALLPRHESTGH